MKVYLWPNLMLCLLLSLGADARADSCLRRAFRSLVRPDPTAGLARMRWGFWLEQPQGARRFLPRWTTAHEGKIYELRPLQRLGHWLQTPVRVASGGQVLARKVTYPLGLLAGPGVLAYWAMGEALGEDPGEMLLMEAEEMRQRRDAMAHEAELTEIMQEDFRYSSVNERLGLGVLNREDAIYKTYTGYLVQQKFSEFIEVNTHASPDDFYQKMHESRFPSALFAYQELERRYQVEAPRVSDEEGDKEEQRPAQYSAEFIEARKQWLEPFVNQHVLLDLSPRLARKGPKDSSYSPLEQSLLRRYFGEYEATLLEARRQNIIKSDEDLSYLLQEAFFWNTQNEYHQRSKTPWSNDEGQLLDLGQQQEQRLRQLIAGEYRR